MATLAVFYQSAVKAELTCTNLIKALGCNSYYRTKKSPTTWALQVSILTNKLEINRDCKRHLSMAETMMGVPNESR